METYEYDETRREETVNEAAPNQPVPSGEEHAAGSAGASWDSHSEQRPPYINGMYGQYGRYDNGPAPGNDPYANRQNGSYGGSYQGGGYQNNGMNRGMNTPPRNDGNEPVRKKKNSFWKKFGMVAAIAAVAGLLAGSTFWGVSRIGDAIGSSKETTIAAEETAPTEEGAARSESEQPTSAAPETTAAATESTTRAQEATPGTPTSYALWDVSGVVEKALPSVVSITSTVVYENYYMFGWGQSTPYEAEGAGTGIILSQTSDELLMVTNYHVIEGATSLKVTFADGNSYDAYLKGSDSEADIAVVAVLLSDVTQDTLNSISFAELGDSTSLKVGEGAIAIGNALGFGQSVTTGVISALDVTVSVDGHQKQVIQTDAAINPGNSGGALLNAAGQVIGINEAKYSQTGVEGIGYAIPISDVKDLIESLTQESTKVLVDEEERGYLGIQGADINSTSAETYGMPEGVYVVGVIEGGPASGTDLRAKDIITHVEGTRLTSFSELKNLLKYYRGGEEVQLTVMRLVDGEYQEQKISVTLGYARDYQQ